MRILRVTPYFAPAWTYGGPARSILESCRGLAALGERVRVLTTSANGTSELDVPLGQPVDTEGVETYYYPRRFPKHYFHSPELARAINQQVPEFDVIQSHTVWSYIGASVRKAAQAAGKPYVVTCHGTLDPVVLRSKRLKKGLYWRLFEHRNLSEAAAIVALTQEEKRQIAALVPDRPIAVIPNGLPPISLETAPPRSELMRIAPELQDRPYVLFLSRLNWKKGLDMLIPAFARVSSGFPDWRLVIAGPNEDGYQTVVEQLVAEHGLTGKAILTGLVQGDRKKCLLGNADVFALPSYSEGLPTCVIEALMCARPVVITRNCYMPEVAGAGAGWVVETSVDGIAHGLSDAMDSHDRIGIGERGRRLALERYSSQAVALLTRDLYSRAIKNPEGANLTGFGETAG